MKTPLTRVAGIGPATARQLNAHGITCAEDLATADTAVISAVPGFGHIRTTQVKQAAAEIAEQASPDEKAKKKDKSKEKGDKKEKGKKDKKNKKDKKKEKGKSDKRKSEKKSQKDNKGKKKKK